MKKKIFSFLLIAGFIFSSISVFGQGTAELTGKVMSGDEALVGATVIANHADGTQYGTVADFNGNFKITNMKVGKYNVSISFIGYAPLAQDIDINEGANVLPAVDLQSDAVGIAEVSVLASVAIDRKTPVAVSTISPEVILEKLGTKEFPEILSNTPSVYATKRGGAFGDSRINLRGFSSENIAVMINGVPVNDMEWGGIYWSNWAGLSDVTRSMQVQRGLGASKIAVPSVGGSINIVTNTTEVKKGGAVSTMVGNDGYQKVSFAVSTGMTENNWAVTLLGAKTKGDGYILGTNFEGYSYFINISKRLNDKHLLSLTGFGAPQWHYQRSTYDMKTIAQWQTYDEGYRFNPSYGFGVDGIRKSANYNFYHKPQFSLNHYWTIDNTTTLSTAAYYSFGTGGGYGALGSNTNSLYGSSTNRTLEGYVDYAYVMEENAAALNGSENIISSSNNNHQWYGVISNLNKDFSENFNISGGIDLRYYIGEHNKTIQDLMGGSFYIDATRVNTYRGDDYNYINEKLYVGDVVGRNYFGHVLWEGAFAQVEYTPMANLSTFVAASISNTQYWRVDKMYYDAANEESDKINFLGYSAKAGANYNLNDNHNVFVNGGYFSRAPFFSSVFTAKDVSNFMNEDALNEEVISAELGYGMRYNFITLNFNLYYTMWNNKTQYGQVDRNDPNRGVYNAEGVNAVHKGIELDFVSKPIDKLTIRGMVSVGDWKWADDVTAYAFDKNGNAVDSHGEVVTPYSDEHYKTSLSIADVHIGDAAQTTASLGVNYELFKGFKLGINAKYYSRLFANYSMSTLTGEDTWQVPDYYTIDANMVYNFKFSGLNSTLYFNVDNILDGEYIVDANNGSSNDWDTATVFYGFGRTWSLGLKINF
ncbi:MAG: TonB-dependent receptor [Bacteroidales bacterium]|nr:TonB-dependent receptor [Bacteroidales bacterium]MBN2756910.1 TonB-dependent receptor [Bacteroidales bacterium]